MDAPDPDVLARLRQVAVNEAASASRENLWTPSRDFADALTSSLRSADKDRYVAALLDGYVTALRAREPEVTSDDVIAGIFFSLGAGLASVDVDEWEGVHRQIESLFPPSVSNRQQEMLQGWASQGPLPRLLPSGFSPEPGSQPSMVRGPDGTDIEIAVQAAYRDEQGRLLTVEAHRPVGTGTAEIDWAVHQIISPYALHLYGRDIRSRAALIESLDEQVRAKQTASYDSDIPVDDRATSFQVTVLGDDYWVATAVIGTGRVVLASQGVPLSAVRLSHRRIR